MGIVVVVVVVVVVLVATSVGNDKKGRSSVEE